MNQHYVPKLLLDGFVNTKEPGNRGVWVYSASARQWRKRPVRRVASAQNLYTFSSANEPRDDTIEQSISNIESLFAGVFREGILRWRAIAPPRPFDAVVTFCGLLLCRNPATATRTGQVLVREAREFIADAIATEESFQALRAELRERGGIDFPNIVPADRPRLLTDFAVNPTKLGSVGTALLGLQALPEQLARMAISFYHTSYDNPFITADKPYAVLFASDAGEQLAIEQLVIPFAATVAAVFDSGEEPVYRHREASVANVQQINANILAGAEDLIISYRPDVVPQDLLTRWSVADAYNRGLLARELAPNSR